MRILRFWLNAITIIVCAFWLIMMVWMFVTAFSDRSFSGIYADSLLGAVFIVGVILFRLFAELALRVSERIYR